MGVGRQDEDANWRVVGSRTPLHADVGPLVVPILCARPDDPDRVWWPVEGGSSLVHQTSRARAEEEIEDGNWSWLEHPRPWRPGMAFVFSDGEPLIVTRASALASTFRDLALEALRAADAADDDHERLQMLERAARALPEDPAVRLAMLAVARDVVTPSVLRMVQDRARALTADAARSGLAQLAARWPGLAERVAQDPEGRQHARTAGSSPALGPAFLREMRSA